MIYTLVQGWKIIERYRNIANLTKKQRKDNLDFCYDFSTLYFYAVL